MSNVVDGPSPHRVPCKGPFSRVPECACDPGSGMGRAEMEKRIAELEGLLRWSLPFAEAHSLDSDKIEEAKVALTKSTPST